MTNETRFEEAQAYAITTYIKRRAKRRAKSKRGNSATWKKITPTSPNRRQIASERVLFIARGPTQWSASVARFNRPAIEYAKLGWTHWIMLPKRGAK